MLDTVLFMLSEVRNEKRLRMEAAELKEWQQKLTDIVMEQEETRETRKVNWVYDVIGNSGKTFWAEFMDSTEEAFVTYNGKIADIAYAIKRPRHVILDLTRSQAGYFNYSVIEAIKNGRLFSTKYEAKMKVIKVPTVTILANQAPDRTKLSQDRWNVLQIVDGVMQQE